MRRSQLTQAVNEAWRQRTWTKQETEIVHTPSINDHLDQDSDSKTRANRPQQVDEARAVHELCTDVDSPQEYDFFGGERDLALNYVHPRVPV